MRDYRLSLADIFAAMVQARAFIEGMDIETFVADEKTVSAVIRQLEIIGEATKNVPMAIRQKYPEVPWRDMAGMRDWLIHVYFRADTTLVWETVTEDDPIPFVKPKSLRRFLKTSQKNRSKRRLNNAYHSRTQ